MIQLFRSMVGTIMPLAPKKEERRAAFDRMTKHFFREARELGLPLDVSGCTGIDEELDAVIGNYPAYDPEAPEPKAKKGNKKGDEASPEANSDQKKGSDTK